MSEEQEKKKEKTIRDRIKEYSSVILNTEELSLDEASQTLIEISALTGNINDEIWRCNRIYLNKLDEILSLPKMTVNRAEIKAQCSNEFNDLQLAKNVEKTATEIVRSLKYRCKVLMEEYKTSGN